MSIFSWLSDLFDFGLDSPSVGNDSFASGIGTDSISNSPFDDFAINPANGLPMVGGTGGVDVEGNPYGTDFSHDHLSSSSFDDNWGSGSGSGSSDW